MVRLMACHGAARNLLCRMGRVSFLVDSLMGMICCNCGMFHALWLTVSAVVHALWSTVLAVVDYLLHLFGLALLWWLLRAGSGYRVPTVCRRHARVPERAFNGYLNFTKPETEWHGARRTSWDYKCPIGLVYTLSLIHI